MLCETCGRTLVGKQTKFCSTQCKFKSQNVKSQDYKAQKRRGIDRRLQAIASKGGKCSVCGYRKNYAALVFHHVSPSEKKFGLDMRRFSNCSLERLAEELAKCVLLCQNCHEELHHPDCSL